jgi:hypothetical protein
MIIYVIGDSHVRSLVEDQPGTFKSSQTDIVVAVHQSKSAYAIGTEGHNYYINENLKNIPKGEMVLLSFGEIDCRHYVPIKAKELNTTIENRVDEVIERYTTNCVRLLKERFRVIVLGAYVCPEDMNHHTNSFQDILEAKLIYNSKLKTYCEKYGLAFVPIFKKGLEEKWHKKGLDYFKDSSHLGSCMIPVIMETINGFKWDGFDK